jgi:hypothetical protein
LNKDTIQVNRDTVNAEKVKSDEKEVDKIARSDNKASIKMRVTWN